MVDCTNHNWNVSNLQCNISACFVDCCEVNHLFPYFLYMVFRTKFPVVWDSLRLAPIICSEKLSHFWGITSQCESILARAGANGPAGQVLA